MKIYIDESGSFVIAPHIDSWNIVGALVIPEADDRKLTYILNKLKIANNAKFTDELKLKMISEPLYFKFLEEIKSLKGKVICVATDGGLIENSFVKNHQEKQASFIVENIDLLLHQSMRDGVQELATKLIDLSTQLYVQLLCMVELKLDVLHKAISYYVQRVPMTLSKFKWFIDSKNTTQIKYENLVENLSVVLLQTRSLADPIPKVEGWNYRGLENNIFQDGGPTYLQDTYGIPVTRELNPLDLGKVFKNLSFIDSKKSSGVQVIDLISSGIRRCLKKEFNDNKKAATLLGSLMINGKNRTPPIHLISFSSKENQKLDDPTSVVIKLMSHSSSAMILA
ncbi:TPA: DUF3800 domain-containing protein [Legionella pneumophila]|nr:DUF3800 domain-containing protein [Legionella pneumophila]